MKDPESPEPKRIYGWKAISQYLGVSVRTAQQWEKTQGLPVRRTSGQRGSVYAFQDELDAWARPGSGLVEEARLDSEREGRQRRRVLKGAGALMLLGAVLLLAWFRRPPRAAALRVEAEGLAGLDGAGRVCWQVPLPAADSGLGLDTEKSKSVHLDVDGDGQREFLVLAVHKREGMAGAAEDGWHELILVEEDGRRRWSKKVSCRIPDATGAPFPDEWRVLAMTGAKDVERDRIWLGLGHVLRFPGVVAELEPGGSLKPVFANHGHVNSLVTVRHGGRSWLIAGGATNALRGGFLALLDTDRGLSKAPEGGPARYRMNLRTGSGPEVYYLLPSLDLTEASASDVNAAALIRTEGDRGVARIDIGGTPCSVYLEFGLPLRPRLARITAACAVIHRQYEMQGLLRHSFERCPDFQDPIRLRRWTPGEGWAEEKVRLATMANVL